ncbi:hypothetical protein J4V19_24540, partial [Escherichia coli]
VDRSFSRTALESGYRKGDGVSSTMLAMPIKMIKENKLKALLETMPGEADVVWQNDFGPCCGPR